MKPDFAPGILGTKGFWKKDDLYWGWIDETGALRFSTGNNRGVSSKYALNDGKWHHVILTRQEQSGVIAIYVNGSLHQMASGRRGSLTREFFQLGRFESSSLSFVGRLKDLRIYTNALDEPLVQSIYAMRKTQMQSQEFLMDVES